MDQSEISRYVGSMQQLAYVRPFVYQEGRSTGLKAFEVKNGKLMPEGFAGSEVSGSGWGRPAKTENQA